MTVTEFATQYLPQVSTSGCAYEVTGDATEAVVTLTGDNSASVAKRLSRAIKNDYHKTLYAQLSDFNHSQFVIRKRQAN